MSPNSVLRHQKALFIVLISVSVALTAANWSSVGSLRRLLERSIILVCLLALSEALFVIGAAIALFGASQEALSGKSLNPLQRLISCYGVVQRALCSISSNPLQWLTASYRAIQKALSSIGSNPLNWLKGIKAIKRQSQELFNRVAANRLVWWGFVINCAGATITGLVFLFGPLVTLPWTSWGLASAGVIDLTATFARCWPSYRALKSPQPTLSVSSQVSVGGI